jgi:hypothetical protein
LTSSIEQRSDATSSTKKDIVKKSKRSTFSDKLNPFSKKETAEEKEERLREKARKKALVEKYGKGDELENLRYMRNVKGAKGARSGAVVLGGAVIGGAAAG